MLTEIKIQNTEQTLTSTSIFTRLLKIFYGIFYYNAVFAILKALPSSKLYTKNTSFWKI